MWEIVRGNRLNLHMQRDDASWLTNQHLTMKNKQVQVIPEPPDCRGLRFSRSLKDSANWDRVPDLTGMETQIFKLPSSELLEVHASGADWKVIRDLEDTVC